MCDICLTTLERNVSESDTQRINTLEDKIGTVNTQLTEIKDMLMTREVIVTPALTPALTPAVTPAVLPVLVPNTNSIWFNKDKLEAIKAPPVPSVLVVGKTNELEKDIQNRDMVEKVIMENNIGLQKSYKNKNGELVIVCDSKESRDNLSTIVENMDNTIPTKTPTGKRPTVAIVGLHKEYKKEEIVSMVVKQNDFVKKFMTSNNIEDHFKVLVVRPTKKNPNVFQAFVSVSAMLRDGIKQFNDKITLGLTSCKVYDQYHVKRCNKCQLFGHYVKDCPNTECYCAKCGAEHETDNCTSSTKKCINCVRSDNENIEHCTFDINCPSMLSQQGILKSILEKDRLNMLSHTSEQIT
jgi:hypothetical protein